MQLLAAIAGRSVSRESAVAIQDWSSTGCINATRWPNAHLAVVRLAKDYSPDHPGLLGTRVTEDEAISVTFLSELDGDIIEETAAFGVKCFAEPRALVAILDPTKYWQTPEVAIRIASAQLSAAPGLSFRCLPAFSQSLAGMDYRRRGDALRKCALLLLAADDRPRGLEEHPLRVGPGPEDAQLVSSHGAAYRSSLSKRGVGWRIHYWRRGSSVTFANVAAHSDAGISA
jgi:hypothetical protein